MNISKNNTNDSSNDLEQVNKYRVRNSFGINNTIQQHQDLLLLSGKLRQFFTCNIA
jgi:hypothetical protein